MIRAEVTGSPAYIFDLDAFSARCAKVKEILGNIPLTFSMKANPFLLSRIPDAITHVEVCSPGELEICMKMQIPADRIIYSGVMKEACDVERAVAYGVDLLTAESPIHVALENEAVLRLRQSEAERRKVLLRLTSGNQFGMSEDVIESIIRDRENYPGLDFYGIHYYSGTQKKQRQIKKDFQRLEKLLEGLKEKYGFEPRLVEYGPGACVEYFEGDMDAEDWNHFAETSESILAFAKKYPTGVEMGRFLAGTCGHFLTQIKDSKVNNEIAYLICDGGIHHLRYYGQSMALQVPPMDKIPAGAAFEPEGDGVVLAEESAPANMSAPEDAEIPYTVCGSLCTVADLLVREVMLPKMEIGDYLMFHRCGAYSVTEGSMLFLSRTMPRIWLYSRESGLMLARDFREAYEINLSEVEVWA